MTFVLACVRTPRGKGSPKGALHAVTPVRLVGGLLAALDPRLAGALPDDVILGCATQTGDQGANLARSATLLAGWNVAIPGVTINRFCASGLDAINLGDARVRAGDASLIVAGGVESVSRVPTFSDHGPLYADPDVMAAAGTIHMGVAADLVATLETIDRDACDRYATATRDKARRAHAEQRRRSIVPVRADDRVVLDHDENVGYAPSTDELAALPPLFGELGQDAIALARHPQLATIRHIHTRGTSPSLADAAALVLLGDRAAADRTGLAPRARIVATATCAGDPVTMLTAGQFALERALAKAGLRAADLAVVEFAEAFAALCVRLMRDLDLDHDRLNPNGGTIALGHAYGATGAVLVVDALDELERRGARYAAIAVSGAAGLGSAAIIERC
ncbi:MAG: acetyl-CoA C-acyltransferase [Deltaproteobacteria bacterium]|nr:acetyl-CoA C-acyltransferase [Deltaproteobacteria bacterium]MDQ3298010.1 acetyl-CoA C-acyltransferase [Myxococcota bacterium]